MHEDIEKFLNEHLAKEILQRDELLHQESLKMSDFLLDYAKLGLTSVMTVNGGAVLAILAFIGNVANGPMDRYVKGLIISSSVYLVGTISAVIAIAFSYLSQRKYCDIQGVYQADLRLWEEQGLDISEEYAKALERNRKIIKNGDFLGKISFWLAAISAGLFALGCACCIYIFTKY